MTPKGRAGAGKVRRMQPKESDFAGRPGYKRKYRPDGSYEWKYSFKPNEGGKLLQAIEILDVMLEARSSTTEET